MASIVDISRPSRAFPNDALPPEVRYKILETIGHTPSAQRSFHNLRCVSRATFADLDVVEDGRRQVRRLTGALQQDILPGASDSLRTRERLVRAMAVSKSVELAFSNPWTALRSGPALLRISPAQVRSGRIHFFAAVQRYAAARIEDVQRDHPAEIAQYTPAQLAILRDARYDSAFDFQNSPTGLEAVSKLASALEQIWPTYYLNYYMPRFRDLLSLERMCSAQAIRAASGGASLQAFAQRYTPTERLISWSEFSGARLHELRELVELIKPNAQSMERLVLCRDFAAVESWSCSYGRDERSAPMDLAAEIGCGPLIELIAAQQDLVCHFADEPRPRLREISLIQLDNILPANVERLLGAASNLTRLTLGGFSTRTLQALLDHPMLHLHALSIGVGVADVLQLSDVLLKLPCALQVLEISCSTEETLNGVTPLPLGHLKELSELRLEVHWATHQNAQTARFCLLDDLPPGVAHLTLIANDREGAVVNPMLPRRRQPQVRVLSLRPFSALKRRRNVTTLLGQLRAAHHRGVAGWPGGWFVDYQKNRLISDTLLLDLSTLPGLEQVLLPAAVFDGRPGNGSTKQRRRLATPAEQMDIRRTWQASLRALGDAAGSRPEPTWIFELRDGSLDAWPPSRDVKPSELTGPWRNKSSRRERDQSRPPAV